MAYPRVTLNRMTGTGSLQRDKAKSKEEMRRHTDELRRKQFSVVCFLAITPSPSLLTNTLLLAIYIVEWSFSDQLMKQPLNEMK